MITRPPRSATTPASCARAAITRCSTVRSQSACRGLTSELRGAKVAGVKLATLRDGTRDGRLLVARRDGETGAPSPDAWPTLQRALDDWQAAEPALRTLAD